MRQHRYQYAVRYRRAGWSSSQVRFYRIASYAHRLARRLQAGDPDLAPLVELRIERQALGPVETVHDFLGRGH